MLYYLHPPTPPPPPPRVLMQGGMLKTKRQKTCSQMGGEKMGSDDHPDISSLSLQNENRWVGILQIRPFSYFYFSNRWPKQKHFTTEIL